MLAPAGGLSRDDDPAGHIDYTHKKQTGGSGQFARVKIEFEPLEPGSGFEFESGIFGGSVPREFIPGVEKGIDSARDAGSIAGFPVIDFKAKLVDGASHDVDSSVMAFEIASRAAFREALQKGPRVCWSRHERRSVSRRKSIWATLLVI